MRYIIQSLVNLGYYNVHHKDFKRILYVTSFKTISDAESEIHYSGLKNVTIIPYYE